MGQRELRIKKDLYDRLNATAEQRGVSIEQFIEELAAMFGQSSFGIEAIANGHE
ncbi:MAG: hypothetical protein M3X11_24515 [Acidobacteriota bacterium]|nr:hypothetical protein [Acidobacteriota bacterium]